MIKIIIPDSIKDPSERTAFYQKEYRRIWNRTERHKLKAVEAERSRKYRSTPRGRELSKAAKRRHYWKYRDRFRVRLQQHYQNNKEKIISRASEWYKNNKDKKREYDSIRRFTHREYYRRIGRESAKRNRAKIREYVRSRPEKAKEYRERWFAKHPGLQNYYGQKRRIRIANLKSDPTAKAFYLFVRSKDKIPCYYCGRVISGKKAHIDHVIAVTKNGNHASDNLCASCRDCNLRKSSKLPSELHFINQPLLNL